MSKGIAAVFLALGAGVLVCVFGINYQLHNRETAALDSEVRRGAPGDFASLPGGVVHYELAGPANGRVAVLVHGFSEPYYLWDPMFQALVDSGYRALRYDLYGRGFSDRPDVRYDRALFEGQLRDLLAALRISGKVDLAAASMGGPIVAGYACRNQAAVRTVSLFDPAYPGGTRLPFRLRMPGVGEYLMATHISPTLPQSQMADFVHPERFPGWEERYRPQMRFQGFRRALLSTLRNYATADWRSDYDCLGRENIPVFLVWGEQDKSVPFPMSGNVRAAIPQAEFLAVKDAAHVPFLEHPEIVNPAFIRFLAGH